MKITNSGTREGAEVLQCYLKPLYTDQSRPVQELIHFQRVQLNPSESKEIQLDFVIDQQLSTFGLGKGNYLIQIGNSSKDIRLCYPIQIQN